MVVRVIKKILHILTKHQKKRTLILIFLMIISGFLEMISVSLIFPFMEAIIEPSKIMNKPVISFLCSKIGIQSDKAYLVFMAMVLALAYVLKNFFLMFETNIRIRFVYNCMLRTQLDLFDSYLHRPYNFFLAISSGEIIRIISNDTKDAFLLLETVLNFLTELVIAVMLVITIFIISPAITMTMAIMMCFTMVLILLVVKPSIQRASLNYQRSLAVMNNWILQGIQGIKEIKVMQKEQYFKDNYFDAGKIYVKAERKYTFHVQFPRFLIEAVSMSSLFIIIAVLIYKGTDFISLVPIVSAIAMAAIRLLPSISRISTHMTDIAFREPMLDKLIENLIVLKMQPPGNIKKISTNNTLTFHRSIKLERIYFKYKNSLEDILKNASMEIIKGKSVGIIGASGAGKTTTVDILLGLLEPYEGRISVDGISIKNNMHEWLNQIGYIPQSIFIIDDTIRKNVAFGVPDDEIDDNKVWKALEAAALSKYVKELPEKIDTNLGERGARVSGGQRQRIGIARALYFDPKVLVFDEATSSLDSDTEHIIMESIDKLHGTKTLVIIAHRLTTIEKCDEIYRVENGKIIREK